MGVILPNSNNQDQKTIHYSLVQGKNLLLIFTRNPELGKCKTRLAVEVGDKRTLDIYKFLLAHTVKITRNLNLAKKVYYSEEIWENDIWDRAFFDKKLQVGDHLGERMANAFQEGFEAGFEKICIIGSDMFDLDQTDIENAFIALGQKDFVVGPATDGGYYLLGMKALKAELFKDKTWGGETVLEDTLAHLKNEKVHLLERRNDVDVYEDIKDNEAFEPFLKDL